MKAEKRTLSTNKSYLWACCTNTFLEIKSSGSVVLLLHDNIPSAVSHSLNICRVHDTIKIQNLLLTRPPRAQLFVSISPFSPLELFECDGRDTSFVAGVRSVAAAFTVGIACATSCAAE
jgi:hypothetical protein